MKRIILAGGSGFLGHVLAEYFHKAGCGITVLTRSSGAMKKGVREVVWDACTLENWAQEFEGADAVINLVGRSVNCRYNEHNRKLILESRVNSTRVLGMAIAQCKTPPPVWINASTATIYKHTYGAGWTETGEICGTPEAKDQFSVEVATAWERTLNEANTPRTRKVAMRAAMVLGLEKNSVFPMLRRLARLGLGGRMGDGGQFVSWIHETDFCGAIEWIITHKELCGPVNVSAPNPVTNAEMMKMLRESCGIPIGLPAAKWMLEVGAALLQTETELIIKSRRVLPDRLVESGFGFRFPFLRQAIENLQERLEGT